MNQTIHDSALKLLSIDTLEETYARVIVEAKKIVGSKYGSIFIEDDNKLKRVYTTATFFNDVIIRNNGNAYRAYKNRSIKVVDITDVGHIYPIFIQKKIKTIIMIPLFHNKNKLGLLTLQTTTPFQPNNNVLDDLKFFGSIATLAILKARNFSKIQHALKVRDLFISLTAHELKTPLTTIDGYLQLMDKNVTTENEPKEKRWIGTMRQETNRLIELIEDMLLINKIEKGTFNYEFKETNLDQIIQTAIESMTSKENMQKITFNKKKNEYPIIADHKKLTLVLSNILSNSHKYSPPESKIKVELSIEKNVYIITVSDQGSGIQKEDIPLVFEGFYRGANSFGSGLGVGLFIAKRIVQAHNGDIHIQPNNKEGTSVTIILPKKE